MKKFKAFYMPVTNMAMAQSIMSHAIVLGYTFTQSTAPKPTRVKFYTNGYFSIVDNGAEVKGEQLCWYKFFELTPEDVVIEPDRWRCSLAIGLIAPKWAESGVVKSDLTRDQIDRIKSIMDEES